MTKEKLNELINRFKSVVKYIPEGEAYVLGSIFGELIAEIKTEEGE